MFGRTRLSRSATTDPFVAPTARPLPVPRPDADRVLREVEWNIVRRLDGRLLGAYRSLFRGAGIDVAGIRPYTPDDDARHIDWNVTARLDEPYVREFSEDRELTAWLLLDRSASMTFGPAERGKDVVLAEVATALARVVSATGNRVGAMLFDHHATRIIEPGSSRRHVLRLAHEIISAPESAAGGEQHSTHHGPGTDLAPLLRSALTAIRRRSLVVLISDLLSEPGWEQPLGALARRHELVVLHLTDPRERELPNVGIVVLEDPETGEQLTVDTGDANFRARMAAMADERSAALADVSRRAGVDLYEVSTSESLTEAFVRLARRRAARREVLRR